MNALERIKTFLDHRNIKIRAFERSIGYSNGAFSSQLKHNRTIGVDKLEKILSVYPDLNPAWVLTGKGEMILEEHVDMAAETDAAEYIILQNKKNLFNKLDAIIDQNREILKKLQDTEDN